MSPPVASAAQAHEAASNRSGSARWTYPCSRSTPVMWITRLSSTEMIAPIFCSTAIRSTISGSVAALRSSVTPSARTAVKRTCSVDPTLGYGSVIFVPRSFWGASMCRPSGRLSTTAPKARSASRWKSIGRSPIRQPPRSGMKAWPIRCSSGPHSRIGMRLSPACAAISAWSARSIEVGSSTSSSRFAPVRTVTPCASSSPVTIRTSLICGTLRSTLASVPSSAATMALGTRFFAPRSFT